MQYWKLNERRFEVFVTTDQNLKYQQDLRGRQLAILVLPTTNWPEIQRHQDEVAATANSMVIAASARALYKKDDVCDESGPGFDVQAGKADPAVAALGGVPLRNSTFSKQKSGLLFRGHGS